MQHILIMKARANSYCDHSGWIFSLGLACSIICLSLDLLPLTPNWLHAPDMLMKSLYKSWERKVCSNQVTHHILKKEQVWESWDLPPSLFWVSDFPYVNIKELASVFFYGFFEWNGLWFFGFWLIYTFLIIVSLLSYINKWVEVGHSSFKLMTWEENPSNPGKIW